MAALPASGPLGDPADLVRTATTIEQVRTEADEAEGGLRWAAEATYEGSLRFSEQQLEEPSSLAPVFDDLTRWIASTLIALADLPFTFLPARGGRRLTRIASRVEPPSPSSARRRPSPSASLLAACWPRRRAPAAPRRRARAWCSTGPRPRPCRWSTSRGRPCPLAALRGKVVVLAPFLSPLPGRVPARHRRLHRRSQRDLRAAGLAAPRRLRRGHRRPGPRHGGPPGRLPEGVRRRLGPVDRHAGQHRRVLEAVRRRATRSSPRSNRRRRDWYTGQPLTYDVDHTDGYILIDPAGRERFVDATAPNEKGALDPKLRGLLDDGGLHNLQQPAGRPTGRRPTPWPPSAGSSARASPRRARDAAAGCAVPPSSFRQPSPASPWSLSRLRRRRRDHAVGPADHRHLADADPAALPRRADPRHRRRRHALRLRPRHADSQRLPQRRLRLPVATARRQRARSASARASTAPWSARCAGPTARPSSPTAATRSTPTTATCRPAWSWGRPSTRTAASGTCSTPTGKQITTGFSVTPSNGNG